jgi:hypothetical protein
MGASFNACSAEGAAPGDATGAASSNMPSDPANSPPAGLQVIKAIRFVPPQSERPNESERRFIPKLRPPGMGNMTKL